MEFLPDFGGKSFLIHFLARVLLFPKQIDKIDYYRKSFALRKGKVEDGPR